MFVKGVEGSISVATSDGRIGDRNTGMKPNKKHTKKKKNTKKKKKEE